MIKDDIPDGLHAGGCLGDGVGDVWTRHEAGDGVQEYLQVVCICGGIFSFKAIIGRLGPGGGSFKELCEVGETTKIIFH